MSATRRKLSCHSCLTVISRCTLNPSDQLAMEGPLSRVKSIKKSLRQSFRRIRRSRVSLRKHHINNAAKVPGNLAGSLSPLHLSDALHLHPPSLFFSLAACLPLSCRRPTLVWRRSWQKWSWPRCRGRSRRAPQTTPSPAWCGRCTLQTPSSPTVSPEILEELLIIDWICKELFLALKMPLR